MRNSVTDQGLKNRWREVAKLGVRRGLQRADLSIARDPYVRRLVRALEHGHIDTVLDIGANVGQFGRMVRTAGFSGRILSVEPLETAYGQLSRRASSDPHWTCINVAVGAEPGETQINVSANSYSSSLLTMTRKHLAADPESLIIGTQDVDVVTVADVVVQHGIMPTSTLLKIDTQGYEQQVLDGAGSLLDEFAAIQLELSFVELYEGQRLYADLVEQMAQHGLMMWSLETGISDDTGRLLQCDGLFVRSSHGR